MSPIVKERLSLIETVSLEKGAHKPGAGYCAIELASYVAGEPWSDKCVSPVIRAFVVSWNDTLDDTDRQMLKPYIPLVIGTKTTEADEETRAWLATDWLVHTFAPAWLDLAGLAESAATLRALPNLTSTELATAALPTIRAAREKSDAAWAAARAAARDAAGDAARDSAWAAARAAADKALAPTVKALQAEALLLLDRMVAVGRVPLIEREGEGR